MVIIHVMGKYNHLEHVLKILRVVVGHPIHIYIVQQLNTLVLEDRLQAEQHVLIMHLQGIKEQYIALKQITHVHQEQPLLVVQHIVSHPNKTIITENTNLVISVLFIFIL